MKMSYPALVSFFLCLILVPSGLIAAESEKNSDNNPSKVDIRAYLEATIIPSFEASNEPLSKVLTRLEQVLGEASGIRIVPLYNTKDTDPRVNITLRNLSAARVLEFICQQVNFSYEIGSDAVVVMPSADISGASNGVSIGYSASAPVDYFAAPSARLSRAPRPPASVGGAVVAPEDFNTEEYGKLVENAFRSPLVEALSTFSIDVDTASYANARRFITDGRLPPADAVRIEELVNYFVYDYEPPTELPNASDKESPSINELVEHPFRVNTELGEAFWRPEHKLMKIGLKGYEIDWDKRPQTNLVFLLDVSGSMRSAKKLPLVKDALELLVKKLDGRDRVAIVVYAGASGLVLPSTTANNTETILHALEKLRAGGSTNGGEGLELAYRQAQRHFIEDGVNRVILCTDGDFNDGISDTGELTRIIEEKAKSGVYLTICGFGGGNLNDELMESLSNSGNGNYAYIDTKAEARRAFSQGAAGSVLTIAQDVKIQVEFNPAKVKAYRLIGYENRMLKSEDFNDDTKDAGELGSGHTVTALYEIAPHGSDLSLPGVDSLKYQEKGTTTGPDDEWATVKLRYKWPRGDSSQLLSQVVKGEPKDFKACSEDFRFSSAVAACGMILRESEFKGEASLAEILAVAEGAMGDDAGGLRSGFLELVEQCQKIFETSDGEAR